MNYRFTIAPLMLWVPLAPYAGAHDGPPYPICVDEAIGPTTLSIWADPDVGEGTFYYYLDPAGSGIHVKARGQHLDGAAFEVVGHSKAPLSKASYQQIGTVDFEQRGAWAMTFTLLSHDDIALGEINLEVDVTPPGLGQLYLLWYAIPFFAAAAIWLRIFLASGGHSLSSPSGIMQDSSPSHAPGHAPGPAELDS